MTSKMKKYIAEMTDIVLDTSLPKDFRSKFFDQTREKVLKIRDLNTRYVMESGILDIFKRLKVPDEKIKIEMSEYGMGGEELSPFPFYLARIGKGEVLKITFHEYPEAYKSEVRRTYIVNDSLIDEWLGDGYFWLHVEDIDDPTYEGFKPRSIDYNFLFSSNVPKEMVLEHPNLFSNLRRGEVTPSHDRSETDKLNPKPKLKVIKGGKYTK